MIEFLKSLFFARRCLFCGGSLGETKEQVFCPKCRLEYEKMKRRACPSCGRAHRLCTCVPEKLKGKVTSARHLFAYGDADSKKLIFTLKERDYRPLQKFLGAELAALFPELCDHDITYAPRKPKSVAEYGFDQAERLAEALGDHLSLPLIELFSHAKRSKLQRELDAGGRAENAEKSYTLQKKYERTSPHLLIIDDVMTTGSTLSRLVDLAKEAGYDRVSVVTVAQTVHEKEAK